MKRLTSFLLVFTLLLSMVPAALAADTEESGAPAAQQDNDEKILIDQVYGGGGKGDTPIANSFVELYNPGGAAVSLTGWTLVSESGTLALQGTIPAGGAFLIVGAPEATSDEYLTCDLPKADQTCDWTISNRNYTITLKNGGTVVDTVTASEKIDAVKVSKQKSLRRIGHADTDTNADFQIIVWEKASVTVDLAYVEAYAPRNSKGEMGSVHGAGGQPVYTPVVTDDIRVTGFYNASDTLQLELAGRYNSGAMNADGGSLEIVQYNAANGFAYAVSGVKGKLIAVDLNGSLEGGSVISLTGTEYDLKAAVGTDGFVYGDMTSVAVSPDGSQLAAAIQAENYADSGLVALFACNPDGSLDLLSTAAVGVQPDMVTFADDHTILTADEGEPRMGADTDPKGSVTVITIGENNALDAQPVYFDSFDAQRSALTASGVLIQKGLQPSSDFEPEYIAVAGGRAYVSLQEANAVAVLDIDARAFTGVYPLGFQDYGETRVDLLKNDTVGLDSFPNVFGIKMPDGISAVTIGGRTYLLTANEGDSRADWPGMDNEYESKTSPTGGVTLDAKAVWFNAGMWDGLDPDKAYVFGGRSFSIYEVTEQGLDLVYDSGSGFEEITADSLPAFFNASNDKISMDNRSGKKGPEPETVVTGTAGGRLYAFTALERIGGVMVFDITDPAEAVFVNYINSRAFEDAIQGDVSPEGLCFVPASDSRSGSALLLAAHEVSGTLAVYTLTAPAADTPAGGSDSGDDSGTVHSTYAVTVNKAAGGTVAADRKTAAEGDTVTLTITLNEGYALRTMTVTDRNGNALPLVGKNGRYTFTMPASRVTVEAVFTEEVPAPALFADVPAGAYYHDAVLWATENGITQGTTDVAFSPDGTCTRAQAVTFLWRAAGCPAPLSDVMPFIDVPTGAYYRDAVLWAVENGITQGTTDVTFSPDDTCTRAQILTLIWRAHNAPLTDAADPFTDVAAGAYYHDAVLWAVENGITQGTTDITFSPDSGCTRAQIVTFLWRALAR
ncbi:MAG: choice-of-anchor I family protein [Butyricicoccaceae bacterium]